MCNLILKLVSCLFFMFFFHINKVNANELISINKYYFVESNNNIMFFKDNTVIKEIKNAILLDTNDEYLLYNKDNIIYLYDYINLQCIKTVKNGYNAMFFNDYIIYESDYNNEYKCRNVVGSVSYRNCYKLYIYDILSDNSNIINLIGEDNYLNDIDKNLLSYTSTHNRDQYCTSLCSFVNLYSLEKNSNLIINDFNGLILDMSGNAYIDNSILYFESVPNIYECSYSQIFSYNIETKNIDMVTKTDSICFSSNNEIVSADEKYLIFKTKFGNYENNESINYIYSYDDNKYEIIDNECFNIDTIVFDYMNMYCVIDGSINSYLIDNKPPSIKNDIVYTALKEREESLINVLEYSDNLSSNDNIKINLLDDLSIIGEQIIRVKLCDKYNNCNIAKINVNLIDKDIDPPKIYFVDNIIIKSNEELDLNKYGYAIDNVDGKVKVLLVDKIEKSKKGNYKILIMCKDSSGNVAYKEVNLKVYEKYSVESLYYLILSISFILVIIIYIFRVKKSN